MRVQNLLVFSLLLGLNLLGAQARASCEGLPPRVSIRGHQSTFNPKYEFAIQGAGICFQGRGAVSSWTPLQIPPGLKISEISSDDQYLVLRQSEGPNWRMFGGLDEPSKFKWEVQKGFPFSKGPPLFLPKDILGWDMSFISPGQDKYYEDVLGKHSVGVGCTSLFVLRGDQQTINYYDPWLPIDDTNQVCGPLRGRIKMVALSVSGSTLFGIDRFGNAFTRRYDFDIGGADRLFIRYSYEDECKGFLCKSLLFSARKLPVPDWVELPRLPQSRTLLTNLISVEKKGFGGRVREYRIEGINEGRNGFFRFEHDFLAPVSQSLPRSWEFIPTDQPLLGQLLATEVREAEDGGRDLGPATGRDAEGDLDWTGRGRLRVRAIHAKVTDFNGYCSPSQLTISFRAGKGQLPPLELRLHSHESIRLRSVKSKDTPLRFHGAIEIPKEILASKKALLPIHQQFLKAFLNNKRFTKVRLWRSPAGLLVKRFNFRIGGKSIQWSLNSGDR